MDFNPKSSKLRDQEAMDKYLAGYDFCWSPEIKIEFCSNNSSAWQKGCIYASPGAGTGIEAANDEIQWQRLGVL